VSRLCGAFVYDLVVVADLTAKVGFGCVGLTSQPTEASALRLLDEAFNAGITHFDTAPVYGGGYSEKILGKFLRRRQNSAITVTTKFGLGIPPRQFLPPWLAVPLNYYQKKALSLSAPRASIDSVLLVHRRITRDEIKLAIDSSRRALGIDYIDYYLLHEGLPSFLDSDALDYLAQLKQRGIVGKLGLAANGINYQGAQDFAGWDILQYEYGPAWPGNASLPQRFPAMRHFFHSALKHYEAFKQPEISDEDLPGWILKTCIQANPNGRVLFFSGKREHIRRNLAVVTSK
jgi:aryl-alcohol dehydrogenase-like predicted oxidoreductase